MLSSALDGDQEMVSVHSYLIVAGYEFQYTVIRPQYIEVMNTNNCDHDGAVSCLILTWLYTSSESIMCHVISLLL